MTPRVNSHECPIAERGERERERERGGKMFVTYRPDLIEIWELETRLAALRFHVDGRNSSGGDS